MLAIKFIIVRQTLVKSDLGIVGKHCLVLSIAVNYFLRRRNNLFRCFTDEFKCKHRFSWPCWTRNQTSKRVLETHIHDWWETQVDSNIYTFIYMLIFTETQLFKCTQRVVTVNDNRWRTDDGVLQVMNITGQLQNVRYHSQSIGMLGVSQRCRIRWCPYAKVLTPSSLHTYRLSSYAERQMREKFTVCIVWDCERKLTKLALVERSVRNVFKYISWRTFFSTNPRFTPFAVCFEGLSFSTWREYIFDRRPTNSTGGTPPHSSLNLPMTFSLTLE